MGDSLIGGLLMESTTLNEIMYVNDLVRKKERLNEATAPKRGSAFTE